MTVTPGPGLGDCVPEVSLGVDLIRLPTEGPMAVPIPILDTNWDPVTDLGSIVQGHNVTQDLGDIPFQGTLCVSTDHISLSLHLGDGVAVIHHRPASPAPVAPPISAPMAPPISAPTKLPPESASTSNPPAAET